MGPPPDRRTSGAGGGAGSSDEGGPAATAGRAPQAEPVGYPGDAPGRPSDTKPGARAARRLGFGAWARLWASPTGYRLSAAAARRLGHLAPPAVIRNTPLVKGWGEGRDIPLPAARSFRRRLADRAEDGW